MRTGAVLFIALAIVLPLALLAGAFFAPAGAALGLVILVLALLILGLTFGLTFLQT